LKRKVEGGDGGGRRVLKEPPYAIELELTQTSEKQ